MDLNASPIPSPIPPIPAPVEDNAAPVAIACWGRAKALIKKAPIRPMAKYPPILPITMILFIILDKICF